MDQFDNTTARQFRSDLNALFAKFGMEHNLDLQIGTIRFVPGEATFKVSAKVKGGVSKNSAYLELVLADERLKKVNAKGWTLTEYNRRKYRRPFIFTKEDGKRYAADLRFVKANGW